MEGSTINVDAHFFSPLFPFHFDTAGRLGASFRLYIVLSSTWCTILQCRIIDVAHHQPFEATKQCQVLIAAAEDLPNHLPEEWGCHL